MTKASEKRPIAREAIEQAADEVEREIRDQLAEEVPARHIGTVVMEKLRRMDEVAYVRFASVYKEFHDADSFVQEIESLLGNVPAPDSGESPRQARLFESQE
jgi:transcriptional repressor NrdR